MSEMPSLPDTVKRPDGDSVRASWRRSALFLVICISVGTGMLMQSSAVPALAELLKRQQVENCYAERRHDGAGKKLNQQWALLYPACGKDAKEPEDLRNSRDDYGFYIEGVFDPSSDWRDWGACGAACGADQFFHKGRCIQLSKEIGR